MEKKIPVLYTREEDCCGCGGCKAACPVSAIRMEQNERGFWYPVIDSNLCIGCGKCTRVCDYQRTDRTRAEGQFPKAYALKHKDIEVLKKSTSGGAFVAFSDVVLGEKGQIYGAVYDETLRVHHVGADDVYGRDAMCGSKYVQSDTEDTFQQARNDLRDGRFVLFSGTPCQCAALRSFLNGEDMSQLVLCDLVCHGVVSPLLLEEYLKLVSTKSGKLVQKHICRSKYNGWGEGRHLESNEFTDGSEDHSSFLSQMYGRTFGSVVGQRPSCFSCPYTNLNRPSDITLADFWGVESSHPHLYDRNGVSMILVNTEQGERMLQKILSACELHEIPLEDAMRKNPHLSRPVTKNPNTELFWKEFSVNGYEAAARKYCNCSKKNELKYNIKRVTQAVGIYPLLRKVKRMILH